MMKNVMHVKAITTKMTNDSNEIKIKPLTKAKAWQANLFRFPSQHEEQMKFDGASLLLKLRIFLWKSRQLLPLRLRRMTAISAHILLIHCAYDSGMDTTSADRDMLIMDHYEPQCILLNYKKKKTFTSCTLYCIYLRHVEWAQFKCVVLNKWFWL